MTGSEGLGGSFPLGPWRVRRAGYGAMQLSGDGVFGPPRDHDEALRVLRAAIAAGVDHIDTAQFYGAGSVNGLIRAALYPYPDGLAIVSKVAGGALRQGIEENLAMLGADRLAAVNLRMPDPSEPPGRRFDAQLAALIQAREEKLIDGIGLSNISRAHLLRAVAQTEIVCVQNLFNLASRPSADVLAECEARNIAFVPFCPLGLPGEERRRLLADPVLAAVAARLGATPVQVALAWLLDLAPNILLIPGTRTRAHLAENLGAAGVRLDDAARAQLVRPSLRLLARPGVAPPQYWRNQMESPIEVVRRFCAAWSDDMAAAGLAAFFTEDAVYHNIPQEPVTGREDIAKIIASVLRPGPPGIESIDFRVINIAADGPVVMTERVDVFKVPGRSFELPVMGTFEISGGKISAWRDYFDLNQFISRMG